MNSTNSTVTGPGPLEVWGYSLLSVTVINLCALCGCAFVPCMKKQGYHMLLMFLVALAVGTLVGSALLFLIPDAFGLREIEEEYDQQGVVFTPYVQRATSVLGGVYMFFLMERFLKIIMDHREKKQGKSPEELKDLPICSVHTHTDISIDPEQKVPPNIGKVCAPPCGDTDSEADSLEKNTNDSSTDGNGEGMANKAYIADVTDEKDLNALNGVIPLPEKENPAKKKIAPVAWMIICGDALHNFVDGLAIGAAFSSSIMIGLSVSVAVLCEEFPHELGDFAILLNSGMTVKQALGFNFLSACSCYIGLIIGIVLGELTAASKWIFGIAGGMFLYISLADMMPEINHAAESEERRMYNISAIKVFIIQNIGLLVGYGAMMLLAQYGGHISFE